MVDVSKQQLATTVLGEDWAMPVGIGPTGLTGLFHANGEMLGARAAQAFGVPFCLSTMSICSIEDVRSVVQKPFWFQVYVCLLYTSDAADERSSVDLGGRRIIK